MVRRGRKSKYIQIPGFPTDHPWGLHSASKQPNLIFVFGHYQVERSAARRARGHGGCHDEVHDHGHRHDGPHPHHGRLRQR